MEKIADYILLNKIQETRNSKIFLGKKLYSPENVIIKVLKNRFPSPSEIARFRQEYNLIKNLNIDGIVRLLELIEENGIFAIIEENFNGTSLKEILRQKPLSIPVFLKIGMQLAEILGNLHRKKITHMDLKPSNILINREKDTVKITDFGIANAFTHINEELYNPQIIEGTLAYISPEQTGRMNRIPDYRTDLYSMGITFYEMLTGTVPFKNNDPLELIYAHIARQPLPPHKLDKSIPDQLSRIILKLLAKTPEERYQNSFVLMTDLKMCLHQFTTNGKIGDFPLAVRDFPIKFNIPQIIVGREKELDILTGSFERVCAGTSEILLVLGQPGIGKSALINELQKPIIARRGFFISGKFEQFKKDVPYSAIIQAFQTLVHQILAESAERINFWKNRLLSKLGNNANIIINVIPELKYITGAQPDLTDLNPEESRNRFNLVFQSFIDAFSDEFYPLVLFLDDIQWADMASLNVIKTITTSREMRYLLIIGAYRDNEVGEYHTLSLTLEEIRKAGSKLQNIFIGPLDVKDINILLVNTLRCTAEESIPLAALVHKKTAGNPFFVNKFIKNLYDVHALELDPRTGWNWELTQIAQMHFTENVIELMTQRISALKQQTQEILKTCACLGSSFDLEFLADVMNQSPEAVLAGIIPAVEEGLVTISGKKYGFQHDRVQEAAYNLIPDEGKTAIHYRIGRMIFEKTVPVDTDQNIFYLVDQLNRGAGLIKDYEGRVNLMQLNLQAAARAKRSTAFAAAAEYSEKGKSILSKEEWKALPAQFFVLSLQEAESLFLSGNSDKALAVCNPLFEIARDHLDKSAIHTMRARILDYRGEMRENVLAEIRRGLQSLGIVLPVDHGEIERKIGEGIGFMQGYFANHSIEELVQLPKMQDREKISTMNLLSQAIPAAIQSYPPLYSLIVVMMFNLTISYGVTPASSKCLVDCGIIQGSIGDYAGAYRLGQAAFALIEKNRHDSIKSSVYYVFSAFISHWRVHYREGLEYFDLAQRIGLETGDMLHHSISFANKIHHLLYTGLELEECSRLCDQVFASLGKTKASIPRLLIGITHHTIQQLQEIPGKNEEDSQEKIINAAQNVMGLCTLGQCNTMVHYLLGDWEAAAKWNDYTAPYLRAGDGCFPLPDHYLFQSLILVHKWRAAGAAEQTEIMQLLFQNREKLKFWADNCPPNFAHKYYLLCAEMAVIQAESLDTITGFYKKAVDTIGKTDFIQMRALAHELQGNFWLEQGHELIAKAFILQAYAFYKQWGAAAKVKKLEEQYTVFFSGISAATTSFDRMTTDGTNHIGTGTIRTQYLDLTTLIKTSQSLLSEIDPEKLLVQIIRLAIMNAGARQGYLIIANQEDGKLYIEAAGTNETDAIVLKPEPLTENSPLAVTIVNYVHKTGTSVVLNNTADNTHFANDPYLCSKQPKSTLCVPVKHKGNEAAILYLENNLATHAFTPGHIELLQILSAQAAISLENSKLIIHREKAVKLETEMQLAKRIQNVLLPENPRIKGYEIAAYMDPADAVGGDYYDIINSPSGDWILIGDVSGHGITAGLVMMMVQTAVRMALNQCESVKPSDLLSKVNSTLTPNIKQLGGSKYMTLVALHAGQEGAFTFAGSHQNILIYRAGEKRVDLIETRGVWLGLFDDLRPMLSDNFFILHPADVILLYTDGIVESFRKKNGNDNAGPPVMFGLNQLIKVFEGLGSSSVEAILDGIIGKLQANWTIDDDISLVVVKRLG